MGKLIDFLTFIILVTCFVSCQKEINGFFPEGTQSDSTDLARIILLDTTLTPGQDTLYKIDFLYDNQNRKVGENFTDIDIATGTRDTWYYRYYFLGNDTLPFRVAEKYSFSTDSISHFLTYSNGFIIKDSSVDHSPGAIANRVYYYTAIPGNIFLQKTVDYDIATGAPELVDSTIYRRTVTSGNLFSGLDSAWIIPGSPTLFRVNSFQLTFDNKPNPLSKLTLWYLGHFDAFDNQIYHSRGINNLLSSRYDVIFPGTFSTVNSYSYTYNNNGYPLVLRSNSPDGNKLIFVYTKL